MGRNSRRNNQGVALISAVMIVAVAAAIATRVIGADAETHTRSALYIESERAWYLALGGELLARELLTQDAREGSVDHLGETWASPRRTFELDEGILSGRIIDLQGRFNLNNLWQGDQLSMPDFDQLSRLTELVAANRALPAAAAEWMSGELLPVAGGAGDAPYLASQPAYHRALLPLVGTTELRLLDGADATVYRRLAGHVTALPSRVPVNVNTASRLVLMSLAPGIDMRGAEQLMAERTGSPFESTADFLAAVVRNFGEATAEQIPDEAISVASSYFLVEVEARSGAGRATLYSILQRFDSGAVTVVMRSEAEI